MSAAADRKRGKARPSAGRVEPSAPATFSLTASRICSSHARIRARKSRPSGGIVAFHLSNRFLALAPVVEQLAHNAGMEAVRVVDREDHSRQGFDSEWVLATPTPEFLANPAVVHARWPIEVPAGLRLWTDDYSSLFPVIKVSQRGL